MQLWEEIAYHRADAKEEGRTLKLIQQVRKKIQKHMNAEEIAEIFEEDIEEVTLIYNTIIANPDLSDEDILEVLLETN